MRTTINIDDDLLARAKEIAVRSRRSLGAVVDDALRALLVAPTAPGGRARRVRLPADGGSGLRPGVDLDDRRALAELLGDEAPRAAP